MTDIYLPSISHILIVRPKCVSVIQNGVSFILGNPNLYSPYKIAAYRETETSEMAHNLLNHLKSTNAT